MADDNSHEVIISFGPPQRPPPPQPFSQPAFDPDHFAIVETEDSEGGLLDDLWAWLADRIGDRAEVYEDDEAVAERTRRWTTRTIAVAALTLFLLNADSIRTWASTLPPTWGTETLRLISNEWADRLDAAGLGQPRRDVRKVYQDAKDRRW